LQDTCRDHSSLARRSLGECENEGFFPLPVVGGALLYTANTLFLSYSVQPDGQKAVALLNDPLAVRRPGVPICLVTLRNQAKAVWQGLHSRQKTSTAQKYLPAQEELPARTPSQPIVAASSSPPSDQKTVTARNQFPAETNSARGRNFLEPTSPAQTDRAQDAPSPAVRTASQPVDEPTFTAPQQVKARAPQNEGPGS
jgi:hypothetical protein